MLLQNAIENVAYDVIPDSDESFTGSRIHLSDLSVFQKILLTTDGTLTEILEIYLSEKIHVIKLSEDFVSATPDILPLNIRKGREVIERKILLQGKVSRKNWLYAESVIVLDRLDVKFRHGLIKSKIPIGKLWQEHKIETFKEIIRYNREAAGHLAGYFKIREEDRLLCRTYRVFSNREPIMMITEKFPDCYYL